MAQDGTKSLEIYQIQGSALDPAIVDTLVQLDNNIVTAVAEDGFYMQTPTERSDGNVETSDGIFVFLEYYPKVAQGDLVNVKGMIREIDGLTQITESPDVIINSADNFLPDPILLNNDNPSPHQPQAENEYEKYEGMLVQVLNGRTTAPSRSNGDARMVAKNQRTFREPGIEYPGLEDLPVWDGNPEVFILDPDGLGFADIPLPANALIEQAIGIMSFKHGNYRLLPFDLKIDTTITGRAVREQKPGEFTIASQNIEWFMDDEDNPLKDDEVISPEAFAIRLSKISKHIREILGTPDILAVQEIEGIEVLEKLAKKIQRDDPSIKYDVYMDEHGPFYPGSYSNTGFLVRNNVIVDTVFQIDRDATFTFDNEENAVHLRPPFVLEGSLGGKDVLPIKIMVVHNKSLGGIEGSYADFNRTRRYQQALSIAKWVQAQQEKNPESNIIIVGDFNAFQFTDGYVDMVGIISGDPDPAGSLFPSDDIVNPNLINHIYSLPEEERYSFVYDGDAEALDHVLTTEALSTHIEEIAYIRGNADAPIIYQQDSSVALSCSDHDGVVTFINPEITKLDDQSSGMLKPSEFKLNQNYPNPFNPVTKIEYELTVSNYTELKIFNLLGQKVSTLVSEKQAAGKYSIEWIATNQPSGVYYYQIISGKFKQVRKMVLMR
jgi:predicted extracellular nuclease